jgi:hypothetical protein
VAAPAPPARTRPGRSPATGTPVTPATPGTGTTQRGARQAAATGAVPESRTRFVFLVVALLGGGLLCLLLVNTVLATGAFQITALQQGNVSLAQQEQALQARIAAQEAPSALAERAKALGMVETRLIHFIDLKNGKIISEPRQMRGIPLVPGYTP